MPCLISPELLFCKLNPISFPQKMINEYVTMTFNKVNQWILAPFPFFESSKIKWIVSIGFGLFIFLFLLTFQPFGISEVYPNKLLYLAGFGLITTLILIISLVVLPLILPQFFENQKWNVVKQILLLLINTLVIAGINYEYSHRFLNAIHIQTPNLLNFIFITFSVALIPITFLVFIMSSYLKKWTQESAIELNKEMLKRKNNQAGNNPVLTLNTDLKNERLVICKNDFLFAKSEDNYTLIHYFKDQKLTSQLLRISLKSLAQQLEVFPSIVRCHRSYVVNKQYITKISGNARSYFLHLKDHQEPAPVSRSFPIENLYS